MQLPAEAGRLGELGVADGGRGGGRCGRPALAGRYRSENCSRVLKPTAGGPGGRGGRTPASSGPSAAAAASARLEELARALASGASGASAASTASVASAAGAQRAATAAGEQKTAAGCLAGSPAPSLLGSASSQWPPPVRKRLLRTPGLMP